MKICIVGGIFDKDQRYLATVRSTPETVLADGLRARGHLVVTRGHQSATEFSEFDVIHVHHLGRGAVLAASSAGSARLVFTRHWMRREPLLRHRALRFVLARSDRLVVLSESEAASQRHQCGVSPASQRVIPNGIDASVFSYVAPPLQRGAPWRLLYVGQLARFKGVHYLLRAIAQLQVEYDIELRLAHQTEVELAALKQEALELGVHSVSFLGGLPPTQLAEAYAACHIFVLPSTAEALPSVVSEAMMVGRPVVATDVGGVCEQVGQFGAVVSPGQPAELARGVRDVIRSYDDYAVAAEAQSRTATGRFSIDHMLNSHEDMYAGVAETAPRRHAGGKAAGTRVARYIAGARN